MSSGVWPQTVRRALCFQNVPAQSIGSRSILPYEKYVEAETVLSLQQVGGERMSMFKGPQMNQAFVADLRRAQAEAEILCF